MRRPKGGDDQQLTDLSIHNLEEATEALLRACEEKYSGPQLEQATGEVRDFMSVGHDTLEAMRTGLTGAEVLASLSQRQLDLVIGIAAGFLQEIIRQEESPLPLVILRKSMANQLGSLACIHAIGLLTLEAAAREDS